MPDTIITFTSRSLDEVLRTGGSQEWVLNRKNARNATYLVCARNAHGDVGTGPGDEAHKSGFLIGKISGLAAGENDPERFLILISEYAEIDVPDLWTFGRNPVRYANVQDLCIDLDDLEWKPMPETAREPVPVRAKKTITRPAGIFDAAKQMIAAQLGIGVDSIEITIRA
jgi:hypothetical protein